MMNTNLEKHAVYTKTLHRENIHVTQKHDSNLEAKMYLLQYYWWCFQEKLGRSVRSKLFTSGICKPTTCLWLCSSPPHPALSFSFNEDVGILRGQVTNQGHRPCTGQNWDSKPRSPNPENISVCAKSQRFWKERAWSRMKTGWEILCKAEEELKGISCFAKFHITKKPRRHSLWARIKDASWGGSNEGWRVSQGYSPSLRWPSDVTSLIHLFRLSILEFTCLWHSARMDRMELMCWSLDISAPIILTQSFPSLCSGLGALEDGEGSLGNLHLSAFQRLQPSLLWCQSGFPRTPSCPLHTPRTPSFMVSRHGPSAL